MVWRSARESTRSFFNILVVSAYIFAICVRLVFFAATLFLWLRLRPPIEGVRFKLACRKYVKGRNLERLCSVYKQELEKFTKALSLLNIIKNFKCLSNSF